MLQPSSVVVTNSTRSLRPFNRGVPSRRPACRMAFDSQLLLVFAERLRLGYL
jgi:hypothetical protein